MAPFDRPYTSLYWSAFVNIALYLVPFLSYLTLNNIMTLKSGLEVIQTGIIRKLWCGFLVAFHNNYDSVLYHFRDKARYWSKIATR